jgi:hypothetical protein
MSVEPAELRPPPPNLSFVLALVFSLREHGMLLTPADAHAAVALLATRAIWPRDELLRLLGSVLVRRAGDRAFFEEAFARLYDRPARAQETRPERKDAPEAPPRPPSKREFGRQMKQAFQRGRGFVRYTLSAAAVKYAVSAAVVGGLSILGAATFVTVRKWASATRDVWETYQHLSLLQVLASAAIASAVTLIALLGWRAFMLRRSPAVEDAVRRDAMPTAAGPGDRTVFRVGALGGEPPPFLAAAIASDIAEMFGYREGEPDQAMIDIRETIAAHMRGGDEATLSYERRRELPTVLILTDRSLAARAWHTLATEFEAALSARGVSFEAIPFPGSFHETRGGRRQPRPEAVALESAVGAPGWTVTTVFAEAHRLSKADIELLRRVSENGPVLFFDLRDTSLWDARHAELAASRISVLPATAVHLRDGLARIFAPDRALGELRMPTKGRGLSPAADTETIAARMLGDAMDWAEECALVQPISFALAEQLRVRHAKLMTPEGQIAFSRLAALQGSWVGPEGIRFEPRLRRHLLSLFSARRESEQAHAIGVIDAAFADEPSGQTESALWRYARAQVHLLAKTTTDDAWLEIEDIKQEGLVDVAPIADFVSRLRAPGSTGDSNAIMLPSEPARAVFRKRILGEQNEYESGNVRVVPAEWTVGLPDLRIKYQQPYASPTQDSSLNLTDATGIPSEISSTVLNAEPNNAAFFPNGHNLVVDGAFDLSNAAVVTFIDSLTLERHRLEWPGRQDKIAGIWTARDANVAVFLVPGKPAVVLRPKSEASDAAPLTATLEFATVGDVPLGSPGTLMVVSPRGEWLLVQEKDAELLLIEISSGRLANRLSISARATALTFPQPQLVLAGLGDGTILPIDIDDGLMRAGDPLGRVEGVPVAIASVQPNRRNGAIVVALDDGRIVLLETGGGTSGSLEQRSEIRLRWAARRVIPFADRPAARVTVRHRSPDALTGFSAQRGDDEVDEVGLSVAVLGQRGEFDIVGLPLQNAESGAIVESSARTILSPETDAFKPLSLLDRDIRPSRDWLRVIAVGAQSRRIAVVRAGHVEVRPLIYQPARAGVLRVAGQRGRPATPELTQVAPA